jgi:hypothetical protein
VQTQRLAALRGRMVPRSSPQRLELATGPTAQEAAGQRALVERALVEVRAQRVWLPQRVQVLAQPVPLAGAGA